METNLRIEELRKRHPKFIYEGASLEYSDDTIRIHFQFVLEPGISFTPETIIKLVNGPKISIDHMVLKNLTFHLGLIELLSYWKAACSPEIVIKSGSLNEEQIAWWKNLLFKGMMEFFYVNRIDFKSPDFLKITFLQDDSNHTPYESFKENRSLVMVSGGKDSAFTVAFLKESSEEFNCLLLNPTPNALAIVKQVGCQIPIVVSRTIDSKLLELNRAGYLNGHTPFSALLAILGVTCAILFGYDKVIVANERSSNEPNLRFLDEEVNHQYSKSFFFEKAFQRYSKAYLAKNIDYFSLLRPLYEIQVIRLFCKYPEYFGIFKSCNKEPEKKSWCLECNKCISTFILFYPFLSTPEIIRIFGRNIFEERRIIPLIHELLRHKPFECVATKEEVLVGLYLAQKDKTRLPIVLDYVRSEILPAYPQIPHIAEEILSAWNGEHNLPPRYADLLKRRLV